MSYRLAGKCMRPIACKECGKVYEGEKGDACPRCAGIDLLMPGPSRADTPVVGVPHVVPRARADALAYRAPEPEVPPPVVIPGPPSNLSNTLADTRFLDEDLVKFAAPPAAIPKVGTRSADEALARYGEVPDTLPCPRCAETIKAAAKMCRFCNLDLSEPGRRHNLSRAPGPSSLARMESFDRRITAILNAANNDAGARKRDARVSLAGLAAIVLKADKADAPVGSRGRRILVNDVKAQKVLHTYVHVLAVPDGSSMTVGAAAGSPRPESWPMTRPSDPPPRAWLQRCLSWARPQARAVSDVKVDDNFFTGAIEIGVETHMIHVTDRVREDRSVVIAWARSVER